MKRGKNLEKTIVWAEIKTTFEKIKKNKNFTNIVT